MIRALLTVGLLASLPAFAHAAERIMHDGDDTGFYLGVAAGNTNLNLSSTAVAGSGSKDEAGFKVLGGWQFHPLFAAEVAYYNPGEFTERDSGDAIKVTADIFEASLVGTLPIAESFHAFGRVGVAQWNGRIDATIAGVGSGSLEDDGSAFNWEVGAQYQFNPHFRLRASFEQTKINTDIADVLPVTWRVRFAQIAAIYRF